MDGRRVGGKEEIILIFLLPRLIFDGFDELFR